MNPDEYLSAHLRTVFAEIDDPGDPSFPARQEDFVFHMLDWADDLKKLATLYSDPQRFTSTEAHEIVQQFLYHASSHIVAASRSCDMFLDTFGTGRGGNPEGR